ncbi:MAG TPA: YceI family protein [Ferruginibacter sp.]|nr:YceI family protein [Ferruginibacter sp.]
MVKKVIISLAIAGATLITASSFISVNNKKTATVYQVDLVQSSLKWIGKKVTGEHIGNVKISNGSLTVNNNSIMGAFDIDLSSITSTDVTDPASNAKLIGHLKSEDFFSVTKFPKASFVISTVKLKEKDQYDITGNLTIKGVTNPIAFLATIKIDANTVTATSKITIDRTKYDIKFRSTSFFSDLGDKAIDNNFILDLKLIANKSK